MASSHEQLAGTPYSVHQDDASTRLFTNVQERSKKIHDHALRVQRHISTQAGEILQPYRVEIRSALVSESNRIENYDWSVDAVREATETHKELMSAGLHRMLTALKHDTRVFQALGLFQAHELAEAWAESGNRPNASEVRALHQLIAAGESYAGNYKTKLNKIRGRAHKPVDPIDTQAQMHDLVEWWRTSTNDPILDATIVHAWLTHIHPFEDGNGRLARLLANLTLIQSNYPPLLLRHDSDRGQYLDALAKSDDSDILPLYDLFAQVTRRTVTVMGKPDYVQDIIHRRLLGKRSDSHRLWQRSIIQFFELVAKRLQEKDQNTELMGTVDLSSYDLLLDHNSDGNTWFFTVADKKKVARWLAWFGFNSKTILDLDRKIEFPSIFISTRDDRPKTSHPYRHVGGVGDAVDEIVVRPLERLPILIRHGYNLSEYSPERGAQILSACLLSKKWRDAS